MNPGFLATLSNKRDSCLCKEVIELANVTCIKVTLVNHLSLDVARNGMILKVTLRHRMITTHPTCLVGPPLAIIRQQDETLFVKEDSGMLSTVTH